MAIYYSRVAAEGLVELHRTSPVTGLCVVDEEEGPCPEAVAAARLMHHLDQENTGDLARPLILPRMRQVIDQLHESRRSS